MTRDETQTHVDILAAMKIENFPISCHSVSYWVAVDTEGDLACSVANKLGIRNSPPLNLNYVTFLYG